jgi:hypothetical protein
MIQFAQQDYSNKYVEIVIEEYTQDKNLSLIHAFGCSLPGLLNSEQWSDLAKARASQRSPYDGIRQEGPSDSLAAHADAEELHAERMRAYFLPTIF